MPTAEGFVKSTNTTQLYAEFSIKDVPYIFTGPITDKIINFATTKATLTYDSKASLIGNKSFEGTVGKEEVTFTIDGSTSGVEVNGTLITPLPQACKLTGKASWYI